jgi:hypothetical protein
VTVPSRPAVSARPPRSLSASTFGLTRNVRPFAEAPARRLAPPICCAGSAHPVESDGSSVQTLAGAFDGIRA